MLWTLGLSHKRWIQNESSTFFTRPMSKYSRNREYDMRDDATPCASSARAALMAPNAGAAPTAATSALKRGQKAVVPRYGLAIALLSPRVARDADAAECKRKPQDGAFR
jgi:hypothetical protein